MPSTDQTALDRLQETLGHSFANPALLRDALTHPSVQSARENDIGYERLEFLGDRVLGLVVAEMLLHAFPGEAEGDIAKRHTAAVLASVRALSGVCPTRQGRVEASLERLLRRDRQVVVA